MIDATGYHRLRLTMPDGSVAEMPLIVAPTTCYLPEAIAQDGRAWGPAVQLYSLRSRRNWGIGDFSDLNNLVDMTRC